MRALILGGNGFIGSHLTDELLRHGSYVRVFDRYPELFRAPLSGVDYVFGDFGNRALVSAALAEIDVVYHLISTTLPQTSNDDPIFDVQSNVIETLALLQECVSRSINKFVFISSGGTVYGEPDKLPILEDSPTFPLCSYGITKLCIEKYLEMFRSLYGLEYVIIRPSNPFGPRQNPKGIQGVISVFLALMLEQRPITIWGDGSVIRDYIFVEDLVNGIYRSSVCASEHRIFNIGTGTGIALRELAAVCNACTGLMSRIDYLPQRAFDIPAVYLDINRAKQELGWQPRTSLVDGISRTLEFLRGLGSNQR